MPPAADYWKVNSYGYPNPFSDIANAVQAWQTLLTFFEFSSYRKLKEFWASNAAPRYLDAHAVESWKATFEEFGLLYVLSGNDEIHITPAGAQYRGAAESKNVQEFVWVGLTLLLRYPLRGTRRPKGPRHEESDLLLYWFLYVAMRELGNYFWWSELERVLCKVFKVSEAPEALATIRGLRSGATEIGSLPLPVANRKGAFYNSLNQVVVHASMYYELMDKTIDDSLYEIDTRERRHRILHKWNHLIDLALGGTAQVADCEDGGGLIARMPKAPDFDGDEQKYFDYLGAEVQPVPSATGEGTLPQVTIEGGLVSVLSEGIHYESKSQGEISGAIAVLCKLAVGQRVILGHDLARSFIVVEKKRQGASDLTVSVRRARPITNVSPIKDLLEDKPDA